MDCNEQNPPEDIDDRPTATEETKDVQSQNILAIKEPNVINVQVIQLGCLGRLQQKLF